MRNSSRLNEDLDANGTQQGKLEPIAQCQNIFNAAQLPTSVAGNVAKPDRIPPQL